VLRDDRLRTLIPLRN